VAEGWESYHETTQSDKEGAFELGHVDTAPNRMFTVRAEGYLPQQRQSDGTGTLEFKLSKSETLEGIVLNTKDEPVAGARVYLHRLKYAPGYQQQGSGSGRWRQVVATDAEGKFHFDEVLPGQVAVVAFDKEFAPGEYGPIDIQLGALPPQGIKVNLKEGVSVRGEVRDTNDKPIASIQVSLQRWWYRAKGYKWAMTYMWNEQPTWYTDEEGKFTLKGAIPGQLYLSVWDRTYGWTAQQIQGEEGQRIDGLILSFAGESIEGVFLDAEGQPVPGAGVWAQGPKNTPQQTWRWTNTDALGRFKLAGLKSGDYDINGSLHDSQAEPAMAIPAGTTGVELKLKPTSVLIGEVTSVLSGRALTEYQVQISVQPDPNNRNRGGTNWSGQVKSPDGRFERPMKPGIYTAVFKARGHAPAVLRDIVVEQNVPPQPMFVQLDQGGSIKGVVRGADGKPLHGVWINATVLRAAGEQRQQWDQMMGGNDGTDSEGRYFIEGVAPGSYRLNVNMGNQGSASAVVSVSGSERVQQDLQLVPGGYIVFKVTDEENKPLRNVYFQIRDQNGGWVGWSRNTDAQGTSRTGQIRSGPAIISAIRSGYQPETINVVIESTKTITVNVQMRKVESKPADRK
jgi:protocatechuate 3,4-dioxygenase beta subunit